MFVDSYFLIVNQLIHKHLEYYCLYLFPGINTSSNTQGAYGLAGSLLGNMNQQTLAQMNIDANKKDWLDQFNQFTSGIGNLVGAASKGAGMFGVCWIAREIYGINSKKWKLFRKWLFEKSPVWFFKFYIKYGEQIASYIHNK